jgi:apolipoprotein N-acyltransferase
MGGAGAVERIAAWAALPALGVLALWGGFPNDFADLPCLALLWPLVLQRIAVRAEGPLAATVHGWLTGIVACNSVLYWMAVPVHEVGGLPWGLALACTLFISACLSSTYGFYSWCAHLVRGWPALPQGVCLGVCWYLMAEVCQAILVPWLPISGALAGWPVLVQAADLVGAYVLDGIWVAAIFWICRGSWKSRIAGGVLCLAIVGYGAFRLAETPMDDAVGENAVQVLFVNGNIDQGIKWDARTIQGTMDRYFTITRQGLAERPADASTLVVWPETSMPFNFTPDGRFSIQVRGFAAANRLPLLLGAPCTVRDRKTGVRETYNRALLLGPDGAILGHYDKERLVPFGEYLPRWFLRVEFVESLLQGVGQYAEGTTLAPLRYGPMALGMLICYEPLFPHLAEARVRDGANILVDISNDNWFGRSPAASQRLRLSAPRCIEQNRWLLRGTNSGRASVMDTRGRTVTIGPALAEGYLWGRAKLVEGHTPFYHLEPYMLPALCCLFVALGLFGRRRWGLDFPSRRSR